MTGEQHLYQRAAGTAMIGLIVQLIICAMLLVLGLWSNNAALQAAAWHAFGGVPLWIGLWIVYQQHKLERIEALEAEQLAARHGAESSIFEVSADDLSVARRRLVWLHKWFVPVISLLIAGYLIFFGFYLARGTVGRLTSAQQTLPSNALAALAACAAVALGAFLVSRYLAGMARVPQWTLLRGGAGYLMGIALVAAALAIGLVLQHFEFTWLMVYLAAAIPVLMIVIGIEIVLNFILGIYRPRRPGELPRAAFDSRLLSLFTSPESIAKTINEAINYQFGFEVTRSWFWQLLSRAFAGLVAFGVLVMLAISSLVIVEPHQQAIVTRFGRLVGEPLGPGLHVKLPWPVSQVRYYDVRAVRQMLIGSTEELAEAGPILWSNQHAKDKAEPLIVGPTAIQAVQTTGGAAAVKAPAVSLVNAEIMLQYRVAEGRLLEYVNADASDDPAEPDPRLRDVATQVVSRHLLRHDVDAWIGAARVNAGEEMRQLVQQAADERKLGVEIVNLSVASVHPPQEVSPAFHKVINAEQEKQTAIERAQQEAVETLAKVAGTPGIAEELVREIRAAELSEAVDPARVQRIEQLLQEAGGEAASIIAEARGYRWQRENSERAEAERFGAQVMAYRQAPDLYRARLYLEMIGEAMAAARKIVLASRRQDLTVRSDLKDVEGGFNSIAEPTVKETGK